MCGRFTLTMALDDLREAFPEFTFPPTYAPRYNIAPTQPILAIPNDGRAAVDLFLWGLIPSWAKDPTIGNRLINARSETLTEKPSFRGPLRYKRCLILADGFYEWQSRPGVKTKQPYYIFLKDHRLFAFAGLWDEWHAPNGGVIRSATIITTTPNALLEPIHNRMPVILHPSDYTQWIDPSPQHPEHLLPLLRPYPAEEMLAHPVSPQVNSPAIDHPDLIRPLAY